MDMYNTVTRVARYTSLISIAMLLLSSFIWAPNSAAANITTTLNALCRDIVNILGVAMIFLVLLAALVYAIGQVLGAETRARATVWSTAMFTGAIMGAVIYLVLPVIVRALIGTTAPDGTPLPAAVSCTN